MKLELLMAEERREGRKEGREGLIFELVRDGEMSPESAAKKLSYSLEDFQKKMTEYFQNHQEDN